MSAILLTAMRFCLSKMDNKMLRAVRTSVCTGSDFAKL